MLWDDLDVEGARLSKQFLDAASLTVVPGVIRVREAWAWMVEWRGVRGVLRAWPVSSQRTARARRVEGVRWLHEFLDALSTFGFPSPRPLPCFGGRSWTLVGGLLWEIVSFLPGCVVGWGSQPPMEEIGALLARYHAVASRIEVTCQRPGAIPLAHVPRILLSRKLDAWCSDPEEAVAIRRLAERLAKDLETTHHPAAARIVIHGDFTNHNVLVSGIPPTPTGVIDYHLAHAEVPMADIGYGLWRSGRPQEDAHYLDLARCQQFIRGYAAVTQLSSRDARALPAFLYGRGLQMIAKRVQAGRGDTNLLAQVHWLSTNAPAIADAAAAAVRLPRLLSGLWTRSAIVT